MKRLVLGAALAAVAVVPATAGAVPPGNTSVPAGSTAACLVVSTPAGSAQCSFVGAGSKDVGDGGTGSGTYTITHQRKVAVCGADRKVSGFGLETVTDDSGSLSPYVGDTNTWSNGIVYTVKLTGAGFLAIGGQGTPGQDMAADPAVGPGPGYAGAEDATGGKKVGDAC